MIFVLLFKCFRIDNIFLFFCLQQKRINCLAFDFSARDWVARKRSLSIFAAWRSSDYDSRECVIRKRSVSLLVCRSSYVWEARIRLFSRVALVDLPSDERLGGVFLDEAINTIYACVHFKKKRILINLIHVWKKIDFLRAQLFLFSWSLLWSSQMQCCCGNE